MPKISIITVCYNEDNVGRTCESILNQTCRDYEWIVIDGGSTGKCADILKSYADKMTVFVSEKDSGIYNAMNKGIAQASGEYLIFMNAGDEFFHPEVLALIKPFLNGQNEIVYGDTKHIKSPEEAVIVSYPDELKKKMFINNTINHQSALIRKDLFARFGGYDESFPIFADVEKWLVYLENGCVFKHLPVIIAKFYCDGVSSRFTERYYAERDQMYEKHFDMAELV